MGINTAIGNAIGIPFKTRASGGISLPKELKESLVGIWIADQNTNESPTRNIIKNKIPDRGGDFEILNAAYGGMSGFNGYDYNFNSSTFNLHNVAVVKLNDHTINVLRAKSYIFMSANLRNITLKIKVTGLEEAKNRNEIQGEFIIYNTTTDTGRTVIKNDGIHEVNVQSGVDTGDIYFYIPSKDTTKEQVLTSPIVIEEVARYQGAFVTDGVDDLIVSQKSVSDMLGGSEEVTVVTMSASIGNAANPFYNLLGLKGCRNSFNSGVDKTYIYGYTTSSISTTNLINDINPILGDSKDFNSNHPIVGNIENKFSIIGYLDLKGSVQSVSKVAWYWTLIANKVLTTDEINQVIAYYNLDKYVAPDIYYDVKKQGITNENHAEFGDKLIDYSGNGKDMQLYNFGWEGMSGVNGYPVVFGANKTWTNTPSDYITDYTNNKAHITRVKKANNGLFFNYVKNNGVLMNIKETPSFKIKVSGLGGNSKLWYRYLKTENATAGTVLLLDNGIHEIPKSFTPTDTLVGNVWIGFSISPISDGVMSFDCDITIEVLPEYEGALVTDGVEDYGQYVGDLGLKDYTVVADRAYVELTQNQVPIISNITAATLTPFVFEYTTTIANTVNPFSFGGRNTINKPIDQNKLISYQSTYVYNGDSISKLGGTDITCTGLTFGRYGGNSQYAKLCLYSFMLFPYSLSEFLIERQLKKRKLGTLYPDMVELRPIVKINDDAFRVAYCKEGGENIYPGDYVPIGSKVLILITEKDSSIDYEIRQVLVNGKETELIPTMVGDAYGFIITKSPQKININIHIFEHIRFEDIVQPYPAFITFNDGVNFRDISWGGRLRIGGQYEVYYNSLFYPPMGYHYDDVLINGEPIDGIHTITKDTTFSLSGKRWIGSSNEPKAIYSPSRLPIPNESLKILGYIPDISGNGNHGKLNNFGYTEESGATADGAIKLDGVEDYISIPTLNTGGKQVLMKTLWSNAPALLYDQRYGGNLGFAILTTTKDDINNSRLAYEGRNENGYSYLNGIWNNHIETYTLQDILHNITITNDVDTDSQNPTIGKTNYNNASYANMLLYAFMLFDEIDNDATIMELNKAIGFENNISMVDFTTWNIVRNPVLEVSPSSIHITNVKELSLFMEIFSSDLVVPSIKVRVTGVAKGRGIAYRYCKPDETFNDYWCETDGEHILPESVHSQRQQYSGFRTNFTGDCDILIEQVVG